jgi:hypothetical protein
MFILCGLSRKLLFSIPFSSIIRHPLHPTIMSQSVLDARKIEFSRNPSKGSGPPRSVEVPDSLQRASLRLGFPPSYVIVGVYRLFSDKTLSLPVWHLCRSGFLKGAGVGSIWVSACSSNYLSEERMSEALSLSSAVIPDLFDSTWAY